MGSLCPLPDSDILPPLTFTALHHRRFSCLLVGLGPRRTLPSSSQGAGNSHSLPRAVADLHAPAMPLKISEVTVQDPCSFSICTTPNWCAGPHLLIIPPARVGMPRAPWTVISEPLSSQLTCGLRILVAQYRFAWVVPKSPLDRDCLSLPKWRRRRRAG